MGFSYPYRTAWLWHDLQSIQPYFMYGPLELSPCGTLSPEPGWSSPCSTVDTLLLRFVSSVEKNGAPFQTSILNPFLCAADFFKGHK